MEGEKDYKPIASFGILQLILCLRGLVMETIKEQMPNYELLLAVLMLNIRAFVRRTRGSLELR